jgi:hypothetical protein
MRLPTFFWASRTATRAISCGIAVALVAGVGLASAGTASADTVAQANQVAADVQAATGTAGLVPASQVSHDANSAATASVAGGTVDVPKDPSSGVEVSTPSGAQVGIGVPNADNSHDAQTTSSGTTVYTDPGSGTATAVQAMTDGVRELFTLTDSSAATDITIPLALPVGSSLFDNGAGGYDIVSQQGDGLATTIASIETPWAKDAVGKTLPTHYSLSGDQLTQHIDTAGATFPVVADPHYTWGWVTGTVYFNKSETKKFAVISTGLAFLSSFSGVWAPILRTYFTILAAEAGWAVAENKCVELKSTGQVSRYSGSQGSGYCK